MFMNYFNEGFLKFWLFLLYLFFTIKYFWSLDYHNLLFRSSFGGFWNVLILHRSLCLFIIFWSFLSFLFRMTHGSGLFSVQDTDSCLFYLELAQQYQQLSSLRENLIAAASEIQLKDLQQSGRFSTLSVELQRDILMQRVKILERWEISILVNIALYLNNTMKSWLSDIEKMGKLVISYNRF